MKMIKSITIIILLSFAQLQAYEKLPDVLTVKNVVRNMQEAFLRIKTYKANFKIKITQGKIKKEQRGVVKYKIPGQIIFLFSRPADQIIYSDGQILKIYLPDLKVVGEQKLESKNKDLMFVNSKNSYYQLVKQYNFSIDPETKNYKGQKIYILHLTQKNVYSGFEIIDLWVSENWFILKAVGKTREGKTVAVSFSNIKINDVLTDHEFEFDLPVDVQTVVNPLYSDK